MQPRKRCGALFDSLALAAMAGVAIGTLAYLVVGPMAGKADWQPIVDAYWIAQIVSLPSLADLRRTGETLGDSDGDLR